MFVNRKKSPFCLTPKHGALGGVLRHPPLCSVFTLVLSFVLILIINPIKASAAGVFKWGVPPTSERYLAEGRNDYTLEQAIEGANAVFWVNSGDGYRMYVFNGLRSISQIPYVGRYVYELKYNTGYRYSYNWRDGTYLRSVLAGTNVYLELDYDYYLVILPSGVNFPGAPTPTPVPPPDYYNGFGSQDTPKGLKGWLKDLWTFITNPSEYGTVQVGDGDTLVYSTPTPQPTPTSYIQQQQIINPSTGEVIYNIETTVQNETSQLYPTDYVWLDDVPDTVPHEFDLNFSVSGTPTEYTTDLNFSETSDAFVDTVSGVSDGVNALGSLLGAMPIEIIIYPIVAFCIWAIFAFIHRLLG